LNVCITGSSVSPDKYAQEKHKSGSKPQNKTLQYWQPKMIIWFSFTCGDVLYVQVCFYYNVW